MPDVELISSSFGGGWAIPLTDYARDCLEDFFQDDPAETPEGFGFIVEPQDVENLDKYLKEMELIT